MKLIVDLLINALLGVSIVIIPFAILVAIINLFTLIF